jgi:hypothetical protein
MSTWQIAKSQIADARAHESLHIVADFVKHSPDLAVDPLSQNDSDARWSDRLEPRDLRSFTIEKNTAQQFRRQCRVPPVIECHFVFLFALVARMGESLCEVAIIRENEKPLALRVETAYVKESWKFWGKKIEDGIACVRIVASRDEAARFVQNNMQRSLDPNDFAIDFDVVPLGRLRAKIGAELTVNRDAASRD